MNVELVVLAVAALVVVGPIIFFGYKKFPRRLKAERITKRWKELQKCLPDKDLWSDVIIAADDLLDEVMKKRGIKGKSMGERLVNAQEFFNDKDALWFGHKLRKRVEHETFKLKQEDVKQALIGIKQALKDLGAL